jgi:hypothetical protein
MGLKAGGSMWDEIRILKPRPSSVIEAIKKVYEISEEDIFRERNEG